MMNDDSISRQAAIGHAISGLTREYEGEKWIRVSEVRESLKTMPSAQPEKCEDCGNFNKARFLIPQPERKKGNWKPFDRTWGRSIYHCTACGEAEDCPTEMGKVIWRFCPNCGAEMEANDGEIH